MKLVLSQKQILIQNPQIQMYNWKLKLIKVILQQKGMGFQVIHWKRLIVQTVAQYSLIQCVYILLKNIVI